MQFCQWLARQHPVPPPVKTFFCFAYYAFSILYSIFCILIKHLTLLLIPSFFHFFIPSFPIPKRWLLKWQRGFPLIRKGSASLCRTIFSTRIYPYIPW